MDILSQILIAAAAIAIAWWLLRKLLRPKTPAEPLEPAEDPYALVPSPRRRGPKGRSGAVALAEPDEADETDAFPPRQM